MTAQGTGGSRRIFGDSNWALWSLGSETSPIDEEDDPVVQHGQWQWRKTATGGRKQLGKLWKEQSGCESIAAINRAET